MSQSIRSLRVRASQSQRSGSGLCRNTGGENHTTRLEVDAVALSSESTESVQGGEINNDASVLFFRAASEFIKPFLRIWLTVKTQYGGVCYNISKK
ncbi:hypothetical protein MHYP_G00006900 [Metynnis hypsauchen]